MLVPPPPARRATARRPPPPPPAARLLTVARSESPLHPACTAIAEACRVNARRLGKRAIKSYTRFQESRSVLAQVLFPFQ